MTSFRYDPHAFAGKRSRPVSALTKISFDDFASMHTRTHKQSGERRNSTPEWALNDRKLRKLLVTFMEIRVGKAVKGSLLDRLAAARGAVLATHKRMNDSLDALCAEYYHLKTEGLHDSAKLPSMLFPEMAQHYATALRKRELEIEIEGIDTYLRYTRTGGVDVLAAIVYLYFRVGLDSVGVAQELGLKPPHVRQLLYRLNETWREEFGEKVPRQKLIAEPLFAFLDA